ncbi:LEAF RUST 10 DISEASE-RESISTANCE LOCUS RECEPTOR-LIKE PROTEIN KINASE-like 2.5 isoform X1 [Panicum hallii]|uniref:LEAF RUST 10 DISEASE-RESISTANCE LOCUS RECEPTOR-LIKE PROTEIN KINASE-like 2.5 isoform X1 n=1 Tax=Panicum hallii TaxID=206008 RepID=UPI000DF4D5B6|nr:LEAF RUST 10 DISEASE-RESISTANCE LOCUS RECEPTOR-LIKE PROTEIN KINASE-like 2.5 isoform X1 [Panicum hallii]
MGLFLHRRLAPPPLLLAILVAASSHGASSSADDGYDASMCVRQPYTCGGVSIKYPFYSRTGALLGSASSYCGYPGLEIQCEEGQAFLELQSGNYTISRIDYDDLTVRLVDPEVLDGRSCPRADHNVTFRNVSWLYYPSTTVDYLLFFINCNFLSDLSRPSSSNSTACKFDVGQASTGMSFVFLEQDVPYPNMNWWRSCSDVIEVPVLKSGLPSDSRNDPTWKNGGYGSSLRDGFQLALNQSQKLQACAQCEQSEGTCGHNQTGAFVACLCSDGRVGHPNCTTDSSGHGKRIKLYIVASTSGPLLLCLLILVFFLTWKYGLLPYKSKHEPRIESFLQKNGNLYPKRYTYADLKRMTRSFSVKLGQGGFGAVYRGSLSNGCQVAVKMLKDTKGDGEEFMNEVGSISRTSHVNVVTLLGFCLEGSKRALIYEYMPNGSLERYAFSSSMNNENTLSWEKLFDIAIDIARGLEYLHRGCNTRIVHFDIKPHNILLDQDFCPKISDFGLAKLCLNKESAISIAGARGTIGYIAPEVYSKRFGTVSSKSDVYSYGMMVLEMVGARDKNINADSESSRQYFPQWIYEHVDEYCISASEINGETTELVRKMIVVGLWCIQVLPTDRPTMTRVVEMLECSTSNLELPPKVLLS